MCVIFKVYVFRLGYLKGDVGELGGSFPTKWKINSSTIYFSVWQDGLWQNASKELLKDVVYRQLNVLFSVFINSLFKEVGKAGLSVEVSNKQKVRGCYLLLMMTLMRMMMMMIILLLQNRGSSMFRNPLLV